MKTISEKVLANKERGGPMGMYEPAAAALGVR